MQGVLTFREGKELLGCACASGPGEHLRLGLVGPQIAPVFFAMDIPATLR